MRAWTTGLGEAAKPCAGGKRSGQGRDACNPHPVREEGSTRTWASSVARVSASVGDRVRGNADSARMKSPRTLAPSCVGMGEGTEGEERERGRASRGKRERALKQGEPQPRPRRSDAWLRHRPHRVQGQSLPTRLPCAWPAATGHDLRVSCECARQPELMAVQNGPQRRREGTWPAQRHGCQSSDRKRLSRTRSVTKFRWCQPKPYTRSGGGRGSTTCGAVTLHTCHTRCMS